MLLRYPLVVNPTVSIFTIRGWHCEAAGQHEYSGSYFVELSRVIPIAEQEAIGFDFGKSTEEWQIARRVPT